MSESERARVGRALEAISAALAPAVDHAMTTAYGDEWDVRVAEEDARRRTDGRNYPVTKSDLAVLLKALIYRRIEPWSSVRNYPRMRALAFEILSLRNSHAHGEPCEGEHGRLVDTGRRLLAMLEVPVPADLQSPLQPPAGTTLGDSAIALTVIAPVAIGEFESEMAELGEIGEQVGEVVASATALQSRLFEAFKSEIADLDPATPDWEAFNEKSHHLASTAGAEAVELLRRLDRLQVVASAENNPVLNLVVLQGRRVLTSGLLGSACLLHGVDLKTQAVNELVARFADDEQARQASGESGARAERAARMAEGGKEVLRLLKAMEVDDFAESVLSIVSGMDDSNPIANLSIASAKIELADASKDADGNWTRESLPHLQDAISHLRFLAAMESGSPAERALVSALRREGQVYSDIGQPEEALKSFSRAEEIVDRYPAADPDLPA